MVNVEKNWLAGQDLLCENAGVSQTTAGSCVNPSPTGAMAYVPVSFLTLDVRLAVFRALNITDVVHIGMASASKGDASRQP